MQDGARIELVTYAAIWISAVIYTIYSFVITSNKYFSYYIDSYSDFTEGWTFLSRKKDVADLEWETIKFSLERSYLWIILLLFISEILRKFKFVRILQLWQILISTAFILIELGPYPLSAILFQPLIFLIVLTCHNKLFIWVCEIPILLLIGLLKSFTTDERKEHITMLILFWLNLKCVSYCLDFIDSGQTQQKYLSYFSYCLYLPHIISGPFISYKDFKGCHQYSQNVSSRFLMLIKHLFRLLFWLLFLEFCLHFVYVNATEFHTKWIKKLDSCSLYGYGYTMGQFFHIKYVVSYGLANSFARFEGVTVPSQPVCIGRIHLYSDMWKYFDAGLYNFLRRYIYIPLLRSGIFGTQLLSSFICFLFVYVWHGTDSLILLWTTLNYIGVATEIFSRWFYLHYLQNSKLFKNLEPKWLRRISCMAASPLLAMSIISNFYFFSNLEIGQIFVSRILKESSWWENAILFAILYTCCQVSTELRLRKLSKKQ
ncbi:protein-cysteine N-palmitoyltransferase Rasp [Tenebrio molitor]|jgi:D-alanyl-lipoteichoic acid acyltransferase DltB (MBOAT superfamily)|uniref:protein-cysteine N-palmitoyltransferase Rasp n=1 Tax=Tenebrio molitor TaxID=7067 RepID=UPI0036248D2A